MAENTLLTPFLKGPKHEIFVFEFFTLSIWVDDTGRRQKNVNN